MKQKNAFTLIELLAIIVILAIIAVITVPIILNIIDNSKKGAAKESAYEYTKSLNKYFASQLIEDKNKILPDGLYYLTETGELKNGTDTIEVEVSGKEPVDGWVKLEKGNVVSYSLKFDENVVSEDANGEQTIEKTEDVQPTDEIKILMTTRRGTYNNQHAVTLVFRYEVPEYYEIKEAGINYGSNKQAGADTTVSGYAKVNLMEPNNVGVDNLEEVLKYNTTGKIKNYVTSSKNRNYGINYSYALSDDAYANAIGYIDLITPTNKTIRVYSNIVAASYNSMPS